MTCSLKNNIGNIIVSVTKNTMMLIDPNNCQIQQCALQAWIKLKKQTKKSTEERKGKLSHQEDHIQKFRTHFPQSFSSRTNENSSTLAQVETQSSKSRKFNYLTNKSMHNRNIYWEATDELGNCWFFKSTTEPSFFF